MKIKIIIADDHQLFIDGLKSILAKELDVSIIAEASNGLELIKLLENKLIPDIIITDIRMPIMDGIAATKIITKKYPNIPILALTMFDQNVDVYEMLEAGAKGYVTKDADQQELIKAIRTIIAGNQYFSKNLSIDYESWFNSENSGDKIAITKREREILQLIAKGRTTLEIAQQLKLSRFTVDTHRKNIHKKLGIKSNTGLVNYVIKNLS
ncbi:response regulator transcription factor [Draconibacterium sp.]|nr:response regulator transcription factor [Draconibacterium sp.]